MISTRRSRAWLLVMVAVAFASCEKERGLPRAQTAVPASQAPSIAPPLAPDADPLAIAAATKLPAREAEELPGLHHVQRLSQNVISGSEPHGEEAFETLAKMGVKTILSVDGKTPDLALAEKHGLRYVHLPIWYKGIAPETAAKIIKAYRELPKPFYVHCFHGLHRGPAAAGLARVAIDGAPREQVLAEMLQWCGTSKNYRGLYETIGRLEIPDAAATASLAWSPDAAPVETAVQTEMVVISRADEALKQLAKTAFAKNPEHPDLDAEREALLLAEAFERMAKSPDVQAQPADYRGWVATSAESSRKLAAQVAALREGSADAKAGAEAAWKVVRATCTDCHKSYRDR